MPKQSKRIASKSSAAKSDSSRVKKKTLPPTRRQFLRSAGAAAAGALLPWQLAAKTAPNKLAMQNWLNMVRLDTLMEMDVSGCSGCSEEDCWYQLYVPYQSQDCDSWCWAACAKMVSDFYGGTSYRQCDIVAPALIDYGGSCSNLEVTATGQCEDQYGEFHEADCASNCDQSFYIYAGLCITGNRGGTGYTDFDDMANEICDCRPVVASFAWPVDCCGSLDPNTDGDPNECFSNEDADCINGHVVVIAGFDACTEERKIYVLDPADSSNNRWWAYDTFPQDYSGSADADWSGAEYTCGHCSSGC